MCSTGSETVIAPFEVEAIMGPLEVKKMWGAPSVHLQTVARTANRFTEWKQNIDLIAVRRAPISAAAQLKSSGNKPAETCETHAASSNTGDQAEGRRTYSPAQHDLRVADGVRG